MKASVQYNDYKGTSAADDADAFRLKDFLKSKAVDIERYTPVGATFFSHYTHSFMVSVICFDEEEKKYVQLDFSPEIGRDDFFNLFKRLEVVLTLDHIAHQEDFEISERITISKEENEDEEP